MKCLKWLSHFCCCQCCHDDDKEALLASEEGSDYGSNVKITFDNDVSPTHFTVVQTGAADNKQQDDYHIEQSLLGSTEVQEWHVKLAEEEVSSTPTHYMLDDAKFLKEYTSVDVSPSVPPTGVVTLHSLAADSDRTTEVSYEFQLHHQT